MRANLSGWSLLVSIGLNQSAPPACQEPIVSAHPQQSARPVKSLAGLKDTLTIRWCDTDADFTSPDGGSTVILSPSTMKRDPACEPWQCRTFTKNLP
jgi:hypothetical protein